MGLADIIRSGIAIADSVTKGVQVDVSHQAWIGQTGFGVASYATAVPRKAIVDMTRKQRFVDGVLITVVATVTFLETVTPNGTATVPPRQEPIDPRDILLLPNGVNLITGPIMDSPDSVVDPATNRPFFNSIMIGENK